MALRCTGAEYGSSWRYRTPIQYKTPCAGMAATSNRTSLLQVSLLDLTSIRLLNFRSHFNPSSQSTSQLNISWISLLIVTRISQTQCGSPPRPRHRQSQSNPPAQRQPQQLSLLDSNLPRLHPSVVRLRRALSAGRLRAIPTRAHPPRPQPGIPDTRTTTQQMPTSGRVVIETPFGDVRNKALAPLHEHGELCVQVGVGRRGYLKDSRVPIWVQRRGSPEETLDCLIAA